VNASFINGYQQPKQFIAAQAPTVASIADFWQMVFEQNITLVVMLTSLFSSIFIPHW
jgi:receptor-type tyrosine-protein phosphatase C